jgi:Tfp pilus assembly protein PilP
MKSKLIILTVLLAALGGLILYQSSQTPPNTPRSSLDEQVKQAKKDRAISPAQEAFLKVQLAVVSYQVANRYPPNRLEDLVPTYFDSVPKNPETGQPFSYERQGSKYKLGGLSAPVKQEETLCKPGEEGCSDFINPNDLPLEVARYDPTGKRDPFKPFDFSARPVNPGAATPLEQYDLSQLRLTAVITDPSRGSTALIQDQAGKGFNVRIGTRLGLKSGVIVSIESDKLKILETETDLTGKETQRIVEMKIQSEPGGGSGKREKAIGGRRVER